MLGIGLDVNGSNDVNGPVKDREIIALGEELLAYDGSLPESDRLPAPLRSQSEDLTKQGFDAAGSATASESSRAESSGSFWGALEAATPRGSIAIDRLKGQYAENLAQLEHWGVPTKQARNGRNSVRKPAEAGEWVAFFSAYVAKESTVAAESQVKDPPLSEMSRYAADLSATYESRRTSQGQREIGVSARSAAASALLLRLQCAAIYLAVTRFSGKVTKDLKNWGFSVTEATGSGVATSPDGTEGPPADTTG